ncbi:MAG: hypothetical protein IJH40_09280 [Ruminococcus sp.]|uniref:acyltransferase family protein n=1 Tax=Ruminococcus sp. TaxID=41978 RepID=UPI0028734F01|nr:acyltransferase family protein [Ruminococcus sp.]MBQ3285815.1 hypothetical protein [Ruminococcus sp.]
MMNEQNRPRIFKFDTVKLLVVVLVVVGSFAEEFTDRSDMFRSWFIFVNSFTAPLYIFLSGLFQKKFEKGQRPNLHKISFYLILGYILKIGIFLLRRWNGEDIGLDMFGGATIEWYFFVIVMYTVTVWLFKGVHRYILLIGSLILGVVAGFLPLGDEFYLMRYFVFLPFYIAGYNLTPARVRRFSHRLNVKLAGAAFLIIYFVLCFREREIIYPLRMLFTGRNPYSIVPIEGCTFYHRLLCYGISAVMIISVIACIPNRKVPILTHMGRNTLAVLFWHYPLVLLLWHIGAFDMLLPLGDPLWKVTVITIAIVTALILALSIFSWPLNKLQKLIDKIPLIPCIVIDLVILAAAITVNILVPY